MTSTSRIATARIHLVSASHQERNLSDRPSPPPRIFRPKKAELNSDVRAKVLDHPRCRSRHYRQHISGSMLLSITFALGDHRRFPFATARPREPLVSMSTPGMLEIVWGTAERSRTDPTTARSVTVVEGRLQRASEATWWKPSD